MTHSPCHMCCATTHTHTHTHTHTLSHTSWTNWKFIYSPLAQELKVSANLWVSFPCGSPSGVATWPPCGGHMCVYVCVRVCVRVCVCVCARARTCAHTYSCPCPRARVLCPLCVPERPNEQEQENSSTEDSALKSSWKHE